MNRAKQIFASTTDKRKTDETGNTYIVNTITQR